MIEMAQKQYIKHLYEKEEKFLREISRITGLSQQTAAKYAYQSKWDEDNLPNCNIAVGNIATSKRIIIIKY